MSTLELRDFESVPAGNGQVLLRVAGRWPEPADAGGASARLLVRQEGDTRELEALPAPGLTDDGKQRSLAFAAPAAVCSDAEAFELAIGDIVYALPECDLRDLAEREREGRHPQTAEQPTSRLPQLPRPALKPLGARLAALAPSGRRLAAPRLPQMRRPALRLSAAGSDELRVMGIGCALGAALASVILIELVP